MTYVDTSVLVSALTTEPHTERAQRTLAGGKTNDFAISEWTITEFSSALSQKLRIGTIDLQVRAAGLEALGIMIAQSLTLLSVTSAHFRTAVRFADQYRLGLRAPDALHLAISAEQGAILCTLDKRMASAGKALGIATKLV